MINPKPRPFPSLSSHSAPFSAHLRIVDVEGAVEQPLLQQIREHEHHRVEEGDDPVRKNETKVIKMKHSNISDRR